MSPGFLLPVPPSPPPLFLPGIALPPSPSKEEMDERGGDHWRTLNLLPQGHSWWVKVQVKVPGWGGRSRGLSWKSSPQSLKVTSKEKAKRTELFPGANKHAVFLLRDVSWSLWYSWYMNGEQQGPLKPKPQPTSQPDLVLFVQVGPVNLCLCPSSLRPRSRPPQSLLKSLGRRASGSLRAASKAQNPEKPWEPRGRHPLDVTTADASPTPNLYKTSQPFPLLCSLSQKWGRNTTNPLLFCFSQKVSFTYFTFFLARQVHPSLHDLHVKKTLWSLLKRYTIHDFGKLTIFTSHSAIKKHKSHKAKISIQSLMVNYTVHAWIGWWNLNVH